ncbi:MAG: Rrf2 family transcriptional regulator [Hyphomicrobiaceae bacterium]
MDLNTKGRYAVMAMADIAKHADLDAVPLSQIADRQRMSLAYLEQIFARLRRAGLVESVRGRTGGYRLGRPASRITVAEVMAAVEEEVRMTRCGGDHGAPCLGTERCLTHGLWDALGEQIAHFLAQVSLQDVLDGIPEHLRATSATGQQLGFDIRSFSEQSP